MHMSRQTPTLLLYDAAPSVFKPHDSLYPLPITSNRPIQSLPAFLLHFYCVAISTR
jgi:hypothetical protein